MSKWAEVTIQTWKVFAVEIEDDETLDDAKGRAIEEGCPMGWFDNAEIHDSHLAKDEVEAEQIRRLADERLPL
jgi:hypothetical protein